jgi:hypothetical protein
MQATHPVLTRGVNALASLDFSSSCTQLGHPCVGDVLERPLFVVVMKIKTQEK